MKSTKRRGEEREAKKRNDVTLLVTRSRQVSSREHQQDCRVAQMIMLHPENDAFPEEEKFRDLTLDIVIEGTIIPPVFLQEAKSIVVAEVFKLDEGARTVPEGKKVKIMNS